MKLNAMCLMNDAKGTVRTVDDADPYPCGNCARMIAGYLKKKNTAHE